MSDTQNFQAQIASLEAFPNKLRQQIRGLSEAELTFRPAANEWSIIENIGHLSDIDTLMSTRIRKIISSENPQFEAFDVDEAVRKAGYQQKNANMLLNGFAERRAAFVEELRYLRPQALARTGVHSTRGPLSISDIIALLVRHDGMHTDQIANLIPQK